MKVCFVPCFTLLTLNKSQTPVFGFPWELRNVMDQWKFGFNINVEKHFLQFLKNNLRKKFQCFEKKRKFFAASIVYYAKLHLNKTLHF